MTQPANELPRARPGSMTTDTPALRCGTSAPRPTPEEARIAQLDAVRRRLRDALNRLDRLDQLAKRA